MAHRDQDTPQPPPPNVQYMPNNMIFTRVQMAGDRAFVVCPRFRYNRPIIFSVSVHRDSSSGRSTDLREIFLLGFRFVPGWTFSELSITVDHDWELQRIDWTSLRAQMGIKIMDRNGWKVLPRLGSTYGQSEFEHRELDGRSRGSSWRSRIETGNSRKRFL